MIKYNLDEEIKQASEDVINFSKWDKAIDPIKVKEIATLYASNVMNIHLEIQMEIFLKMGIKFDKQEYFRLYEKLYSEYK